ncbi:hypothetical protein [Acinetobacter baumannii]|uniref:hypothetical protein n=1 Tax=Acinetobacter baumannii TaxID=470 RepID=UPI0014863BF9|nr:hypothetical protein [Acinetobacter baumannii]
MTKAIVAIGVLCLVAYLLTIGYIPSEISFGDTLIFRKHPANTALPSGPISLNLVPT